MITFILLLSAVGIMAYWVGGEAIDIITGDLDTFLGKILGYFLIIDVDCDNLHKRNQKRIRAHSHHDIHVVALMFCGVASSLPNGQQVIAQPA